MKFFGKIAAVFLLLSLLGVAVCGASVDFLTSEDRQWLKEHPVITIGPDPDPSLLKLLTVKGTIKD